MTRTAGGPSVTVLPDRVVVATIPGETVLAALARCGFAYRTGCRRGGCGVCKLDILDGEVRYPHTVADAVLTRAEQAERVCLSCRAVPFSDVVVRLQDDDRLRSVWPPRLRATQAADVEELQEARA